MIIRQLVVENFGIYEGEQVFDLVPRSSNGYTRPIVLLRGKNGSGKTTLIEAIRLCLHGSLSLGDRVSRANYEAYLAKRIHVAPGQVHSPASARIVLVIEYVSGGQENIYKIERTWNLNQGRIKEEICVWENGVTLPELETREEIESFLRELILPGVADLFFFDGEKLHTLAQTQTINTTLGETMKALLGLQLVEQLQKDLDIYLSRQRSNGDIDALQRELLEVARRISGLDDNRSVVLSNLQQAAAAIAEKQRAIVNQKQRIASQGSWFTERLEHLQTLRQSLLVDIEILRRQAQDAASGLLPFAIAPQITKAVADRLGKEALYEKAMTAQEVLNGQLVRLQSSLISSDLWERIGISIDAMAEQKIFDEVAAVLRQTVPVADLSEQGVIHRVSEVEQQTLLRWIETVTTTTPQEFCSIIHQLSTLQEALEQVEQEMALVPDDELLSPLVEVFQMLNRELGALQKIESDLTEQLRRLDYQLEQSEKQLVRVRQQIAEQERHNQRIQLAVRTQSAFQSYAQALTREKIALLAQKTVVYFNILCRKEDLLDAVKINEDTFALSFYRQGTSFDFSRFSAGERQLLAMALMWALREVSGIPLPVIIDTPLSRLDSTHRLNVVHNYFPRISHQVILLATDTEIDEQLLADLTPAISHVYYLDYSVEQGRTLIHEGLPVDDLALNGMVAQ